MQSEPHFVRRLQVPPRIDTRVVFSVYAAVAIAIGLTIVGTGIRGLPGVEYLYASLIWIGGTAICAAGCAAWGLALNDDPVGCQRALRLFAVGHLLLGLMLWFQWGMYWAITVYRFRSRSFRSSLASCSWAQRVRLRIRSARQRQSRESDRHTTSISGRSRAERNAHGWLATFMTP